MFENPNKNRLEEEIEVFKWLMMQPKLVQGIPVFLFLNKKDIFEKMILTKDLGEKFKDYHGGCNSQKALEYISQRFISQHPNKEKLKVEFVTAKVKKDVRDAFTTVVNMLYTSNKDKLAQKAKEIRERKQAEYLEQQKESQGQNGCC
jgi:GTPase SAR1 family protein